MYGFVLNMWIMKKISEGQVRSYAPLFITEEERDMILATPQND